MPKCLTVSDSAIKFVINSVINFWQRSQEIILDFWPSVMEQTKATFQGYRHKIKSYSPRLMMPVASRYSVLAGK